MLERDCLKAKEHPVIAEFAKLLEKTVGDGVLSFSEQQKREFMPFWKHLIIARFHKDKNDFEIVLFGSSMADAYSKDHTGQLLSDMGLNNWEEAVKQLHLDVLNNNQRLYSCGDFGWLNKGFMKWYQLKVPLKRHGRVEETLTCVCYGDNTRS